MADDWPAKKIARLRALWAEGLSMSLIGEKMGITKSAVVGKVHRLELPARPSPIRRNAAKAEQPARQRHTGLLIGPMLPIVIVPPPPPAMFQSRAPRACCWPFGDPGTRGFRFCGDPAKPDRPYCPEHCAQAYIPLKPREIADAA